MIKIVNEMSHPGHLHVATTSGELMLHFLKIELGSLSGYHT